MGGPARGYSWPPFEKGNTVAVKHGLDALAQPHHGSRLLPHIAERIEAHFEELRGRYPHLHEADAQQFRLYCDADAKAMIIGEWIDKVITGQAEVHPRKGAPRSGVEAVPDAIYRAHRAYMSQARELARDLGLNPGGRYALAKDFYTAARTAKTQGLADLIRDGLKELDAEERPT